MSSKALGVVLLRHQSFVCKSFFCSFAKFLTTFSFQPDYALSARSCRRRLHLLLLLPFHCLLKHDMSSGCLMRPTQL
uniref:Uncharacterized protein n=1 Tax=Caenorhabditis japonica TaxID=281687 RepID=A0A8R1EEB4_CAEJA